MKAPRYSVLIASRDEGGALRRTIQSVLAAGADGGLEVVVIDDASTDGSADSEIHLGWGSQSVRILRNDAPAGLIASRARAARESRGRCLVFLDAHCAVEGGWLEDLDRALDSVGGQGLAVPSIHEIDEGSWAIDTTTLPGSASTISSPFLDFAWDEPVEIEGKECTCTIAGGAWMVRREWYDRLGGLDEDMAPWGGENIDFPLRTWVAGGFCLVSEKTAVGHLYRKAPRPEVEASDILRNKIRAVHTVFSKDLFRDIMVRLRSLPPFSEALAKARAGRSSLARIKERMESLRVRGDSWVLDTFRLPLMDSPAFHRASRRRGPSPRPARGPLVSVVVPARGGAEAFLETVGSVLEESTYGNRELIVVAAPGAPELVEAAGLFRAREPRVRVLTTSGPLGGAVPERLGASATAAPYCAFLEPGMHPLDPDWIEKVILSFETYERAVLIAPAILSAAPAVQGDPIHRLETSWSWSTPSWIDERWVASTMENRPRQCLCPPRGALFIDRGRFIEMGGFDPTVERGAPPLLDLAMRIWLLGHEVIRDPRIRFGRSSGPAPAALDRWTQYARTLPILKCFRSRERIRALRGRSPLAEPLLERHRDHIRREERRLLDAASFEESWLFYKFRIEDEPLE